MDQYIDLGMNTARFEASVKSANGAVIHFQKKMNRSVDKLNDQFNKLGLAIVGVAGPAALGFLVKSSFETADALAKTADKLGLTTEGLAGLQYAATLTGVSSETLNKSLTKQQKALADADRGVLTYKQHFDALGLPTCLAFIVIYYGNQCT